MSFVLHTSGAGYDLAAAARNTVDGVSKDIPITHVEPMQVLVDRAHAESRFASLLATLRHLWGPLVLRRKAHARNWHSHRHWRAARPGPAHDPG
ncbi:MAG: hypothetical protein WA294_16745 [Acidobacteriaceae bacterium]